MGVGGLALATSLANWVNAGLLAVLLKRRVGSLDGGRILQSLLRQAGPTVAFGGVCWWVMGLTTKHFGEVGATAKLANVFLPMAAATAVFVGLAWLSKVEELTSAWALLTRRSARRA